MRTLIAVSPSSEYRVLREAGVLERCDRSASRNERVSCSHLRLMTTGIVGVRYLNIARTFYYLCSVLDGYSRDIVHWEIREQMKETDVEIDPETSS